MKKIEIVRRSLETKESENNEISESRISGTMNQFFRILGNQESSQDQTESIENGSQLSDFSLKLGSVGRMSEDFFDF